MSAINVIRFRIWSYYYYIVKATCYYRMVLELHNLLYHHVLVGDFLLINFFISFYFVPNPVLRLRKFRSKLRNSAEFLASQADKYR